MAQWYHPTALFGQPLYSRVAGTGGPGMLELPCSGFLPRQVTEFHLKGKCYFAASCHLCVMDTVTFC